MHSEDTCAGYEGKMRSFNRGHALFNPHPGYRDEAMSELNPRVDLGDVGYIARGTFRLLFNIHRDAGDERQIHGVPPDFVKLELHQTGIDRHKEQLRAPAYLSREYGVSVTSGLEVNVPGIGGGSLEYDYKHKYGATLAYYDLHELVVADNTAHYEQYFREHFRSWLEFLRGHFFDGSVRLEDLLLVTGFERARAWATAWSTARSRSATASLKAEPLVVPGLSVALTGSAQWHEVVDVDSKAGPPLEELRCPLAPTGDPTGADVPAFPSGIIANQCIFVRGLRGRHVTRLRRKLELKAAAGPHVLPAPDRRDDDGPAVLADSTRGEPENLEELVSIPARPASENTSLLAYALKVIAEHYNPYCSDDILLMHDDELEAFLPAYENHTAWEHVANIRSYLANRLRESPPRSLKQVAEHWVQHTAGTPVNTHVQLSATSTSADHGPRPDNIVSLSCTVIGVGPGGITDMLARVAIIDFRGKPLADYYAIPTMPVSDYRTRTTGIQPQHLVAPRAHPFERVQQWVASVIKDKVIVGHSLWKDLSVLGLPHGAIHTRDIGLYQPFRSALKSPNQLVGLQTLTWKILRRHVQNEGKQDAVENAQAALDLYRSHAADWERAISEGRWPTVPPPSAFARCYL